MPSMQDRNPKRAPVLLQFLFFKNHLRAAHARRACEIRLWTHHNPTREAWETNIAALENGKYGFAFASGMSAIAAALSLVKPGEHVIAGSDMHGGTYRYLSKILSNFGIEISYVNMSPQDPVGRMESAENAIRSNTSLIYAETPTNPMMNLTDLAALGKLGRERSI